MPAWIYWNACVNAMLCSSLGTNLACMMMPENVPIMLTLCSMLAKPHYARNYAGLCAQATRQSLADLSTAVGRPTGQCPDVNCVSLDTVLVATQKKLP